MMMGEVSTRKRETRNSQVHASKNFLRLLPVSHKIERQHLLQVPEMFPNQQDQLSFPNIFPNQCDRLFTDIILGSRFKKKSRDCSLTLKKFKISLFGNYFGVGTSTAVSV